MGSLSYLSTSAQRRLVYYTKTIEAFVRFHLTPYATVEVQQVSTNVIRAKFYVADKVQVQTIDFNLVKMTMRVRRSTFYTTAYRRLYRDIFDVMESQIGQRHKVTTLGIISDVTYFWI
jgi:hypothetical protein